jgi:hypothetical protein
MSANTYAMRVDVKSIRTTADIQWYLLSWLEKIPDGPKVIYEGREFVQCMGFRRFDCIHALFHDPIENDFGFHVGENAWTGEAVPNMGLYPTLSECFCGVSQVYAKSWGLPPPHIR